jgi:hypothetical protein
MQPKAAALGLWDLEGTLENLVPKCPAPWPLVPFGEVGDRVWQGWSWWGAPCEKTGDRLAPPGIWAGYMAGLFDDFLVVFVWNLVGAGLWVGAKYNGLAVFLHVGCGHDAVQFAMRGSSLYFVCCQTCKAKDINQTWEPG